jgi:predicted DNA-binding transcriptional regulator AlpA
MTTEERISRLFTSPAAVLARIDAVLNGDAEAVLTPPPARLLTHSEAARRLSVSRCTAWRMEKDGVLPVVEIRPGVYRVPESSIAALVGSARPRPSRKGGRH